MNKDKLLPPCSYQGGKQRLAKQIVDIIFEQNDINENTKFYDLCCGSGAISLELVNRGIHPNNITMIDKGDFGAFWQSIANDEFDIDELNNIVNDMPEKSQRKDFLLKLSNNFNKDRKIYDYLLLQSGSFGGKALWSENNKWKHHGFRDYWQPTETSIRRSPCNPTQPEPHILLERVELINKVCGGCIRAIQQDAYDFIDYENLNDNNCIIYIDPPYSGTTGYNNNLDITKIINRIHNKNKHIPIYVSECNQISNDFILIKKGKSKGNITGIVKNKRKDDLLNIFRLK